MLSNFYSKQNYYNQQLVVFTKIQENDKIVLKNNQLVIKNNDDCNEMLGIITFIFKLLSNENNDSKYIKKHVEDIFTEYLNFIDSIICYMYKKQCFQDQYLILLTEIEKDIKKMNIGLSYLVYQKNDHELTSIYKSVLFSFFDFSIVLNDIKKKINIENTRYKKINLKKDDRTNSF